MSQSIPEIPEVLRLQAISAGLEAPETDALWENYCRWSLANYPDRGLGGTSWTRQIKMQVERRATEDTKRIFVAQDRARKKAAEDAAYAREACTFGQWVALLQARSQRGEVLPAHEQSVVAWASTHQTGGLLDFMGWNAAQAPAKPARKTFDELYVSPDERRRVDLEELDHLAKQGGV